MLTIHPVSAGTGIDYLLSTVASDDRTLGVKENNAHWAEGVDTPGVWIGLGAEVLGLNGEVTQQHADALFKYGEDPSSGETLGRRWRQYKTVEQRYAARLLLEPNASQARKDLLRAQVEQAGERAARAGWEMVVSPVKSWQAMLAVADDEGREKLLAIEERAFRKMWDRIEADAAYARIGANGVAQVRTEGLTGAVFTHQSSRAGDPAFHRHIAISSKVLVDGKWLALDARPLHRMRVTFGELYTAEVERGMAADLGITATEREDSLSFDKRPVREFRGVEKPVLLDFSSRRQQTEKHLRTLLSTFRAREEREPNRAELYQLGQVAALTARPEKELRSEADSREDWRSRARAAGLAQPENILEISQRASAKAAKAAKKAPRTPEEMALAARRDTRLEDIPRSVVTVLEQQRETWSRPNAEAEVIRQLTTTGWHIKLGDQYDSVVQQLTSAALSPTWCELVDMPALLPVPSAYIREDGTSLFLDAGCTRYTSHNIKAAERAVVEAALAPSAVRTLTVEQIDAALEAGRAERGFDPSEEQLAAVRGVFTGDRQVQAIIGRAGAGKTTIMALLREVGDVYGFPVIGFSNGQVQADILGDEARIRTENLRRWLTMSEFFATQDPEWQLPAEAIVIIDEAGQAASTDMASMLRQAAAKGGRLVPVGDPLQLGAPGPGGLLAQIEADAGAIYLHEVRRFRDHDGALRTWEIEAAKALALGDAKGSFDAYHSRGRIAAGSADAMAEKAYDAWRADTRDGLRSILIASDNATAAALSARAQEDLIRDGIVQDRRTTRLSDGNRAGAGDTIVTRKIDRKIKVHGGRGYVRNGDMWTVTRVRRDGSLVVRSTDSKANAVLPAPYVEHSVELGYAVTKDRAQGLTTDTAHALFAQGMTRNGAYPSATRGRFANFIYLVITPDRVPIVGEPDPVRTARQAWAQIVETDGTTRSATVAQRESLDASEALHTLVPQLRFTLDDLAGDRLLELRERVPLAERIVTAEAWPALRDVMTRIDAGGSDSIEALQRAIPTRGFGDAEDVAAVLHWRLHQDEQVLAALDAAEQRPLAQATGQRVLDQLHLVLPTADDSEKNAFAHALARDIAARAEALAATAAEEATLATGWAAAFGPSPADPQEAAAWRANLASAAAYRDLAQWTDATPLGPAPEPGPDHLRRLWRDGQPPVEEAVATARVLAAVEAGARWLDALGPLPEVEDPRRTAWMDAARAVDSYRQRWDYGREDVAVGPRPTEPIQALDHDAARATITTWHQLQPAHQPVAEADRQRLVEQARRGEEAGARAARAAQAADEAHTARLAATAAEQAAADAANRAETMLKAAQQPGRSTDIPTALARAEELAEAAEHAAEAARQAEQHARNVEVEVTELAPQAIEDRAAERSGSDAEVALAALGPEPTAQSPAWRQRPFGRLTDTALKEAQANALATARLADLEADEAERRAAALDADLAPGGRIDTETATLAEHVEAITTLRQAQTDLGQLGEQQRSAVADAAEAATRLAATGRFGRPVLRGPERDAVQEQAARAQAAAAAAEQRAAEIRTEIQRITPLAGDPAGHERALAQWQQLGGSIEAITATEREVTAGDATRARLTAEQLRRRAADQRERAGGLRSEARTRAAMDPQQRQAEDADRTRAAAQAQQQRAQNAAQDATRQQLEQDRNRNNGRRR
ncbi:MobF family relaxase [Kitasatospora sp. NPDC001261]|uniref:MobF family relaxase n=1 Tax=Kitasatospora sp. NPDC001261 TaxID=3364012 RepID=UPI00368EDE6F